MFVDLIAYTWYHFSDIKLYLEAGRSARDQFNRVAQTWSEQAKRHPNKALDYLRNIAKSYVAIVPGAYTYVDDVFDKLDEIHHSHREEVDSIVASTLEEIRTMTSDNGSLKDRKKALKVMEIMRRRIGQLSAIGVNVGGDTLSPLMEKYPEVRDKIGDSYEQMKVVAQEKGADAKALLDETAQQASVDQLGLYSMFDSTA